MPGNCGPQVSGPACGGHVLCCLGAEVLSTDFYQIHFQVAKCLDRNHYWNKNDIFENQS